MKKYIGTKVVNAPPAWRVMGKVYLKDEAVPRSMNREDGYKVVYEGGRVVYFTNKKGVAKALYDEYDPVTKTTRTNVVETLCNEE